MLFVISSILYYFLELPFLKIRPKIIKQENIRINDNNDEQLNELILIDW